MSKAWCTVPQSLQTMHFKERAHEFCGYAKNVFAYSLFGADPNSRSCSPFNNDIERCCRWKHWFFFFHQKSPSPELHRFFFFFNKWFPEAFFLCSFSCLECAISSWTTSWKSYWILALVISTVTTVENTAAFHLNFNIHFYPATCCLALHYILQCCEWRHCRMHYLLMQICDFVGGFPAGLGY